MLTTTHDGSGAVTAAVTPSRVVCMNTLRAALDRAQASYRIRHTSGAQARLDEAQRVLGLTRGAAERVRQRAEQLSSTRISDQDWRSFLDALVPDPPDSRQGRARAANVRDEIDRLYHGERFGQDEVRGTAWGAWQAVVAYNDHAMTSRRTRTSTAEETRFERILGGANIGSRRSEERREGKAGGGGGARPTLLRTAGCPQVHKMFNPPPDPHPLYGCGLPRC